MTEFQPSVIGAQVDSRRRPFRGMVLCLLAGFTVMALPFVEHAMLYAIVLGLLVCLVGPLAFAWFRDSLDYFESIHVFGVIYFVYFGLGAVWTVNDPSYVAYDIHIVPYIPRAALYCLLGYVAFIAAYYGPWQGRIDRPQKSERMRGPQYMLLIAGLGLLGFMGVAVQERNFSIGGGITPIIGSLTQLAPLFFCAWALGWLLFFTNEDSRAQRFVLLGLLTPGALLTAAATTGDKSLLIELIGIPIVARWYSGRKIPWTTLVVLLLVIVFAVFPFYNTYRWSDPNLGQVDRAAVTYERIQSWDSNTYYMFSVGSFTRRLAMINSVGVVVRDVGRWTPYAKGRTIFMPIVVQFIPRVIWPDKPVGSMGRDFGRLFRVTNTFTRDTYIGVTTPGELYWNFGLPGVIAGMAMVGFALRWLYRRYGEGQVDPIRRAIHILLIIQIAHLGASMAGDLVVMVRTLIVLEGLRWLSRHFGWLEVVDRDADDPTSGRSPATLPAGS